MNAITCITWFCSLVVLRVVSNQAAVIFSDNTFNNSNWISTVLTAGAGATASASQSASGGNPGACRRLVHDIPNGASLFVFHQRAQAMYVPATQGAIASIDYREDSIMFTANLNGMRTGPAFRQGTNIFVYDALRTPETSWTAKIATNLTSSDFVLVAAGYPAFTDNTVHPDFSESAPALQFGFFRGNSNSGTRDGGIDNWMVEVNTKSPPPEGCLPLPVVAVSQNGVSQVELNVNGVPGINYALEQSADLAHWTRVATNRSDSGIVAFPTASSSSAAQFFRAVSVMSSDGLGGSFLFDGETFTGWEGDTTEIFHIADCAIVGGSLLQALPENRYLCTTRRFTNLVLRLEFKLVDPEGSANTGIQFRSERVPGSADVSGYQADMALGYWGSLYDQSRRGSVLAAANQAAVNAVLRKDDWNEYVIRADGPRVQFWINGYQTIDYTETVNAIPRGGIIGIQIHSGDLFEASFRHISLEVLP
jgi:hypothetical protein